ncbi:rhodanese [bacterium]|nr:rhodanese [bacterium]
MTEPLPLEIDCQTTRAKQTAGESFVFLDCREQDEFDAVHIAGTVLLPMTQLQARVGELDGRQDEEIIVHCHHGGRSLRVAQWLRQQGFPKAVSMAGGIDAWAVHIEPGMARY